MLVYRSVCNATIDGRNPKQPLEMYKTPVILGEFSKTLGIPENTFKHFLKEASLNCNKSFRDQIVVMHQATPCAALA